MKKYIWMAAAALTLQACNTETKESGYVIDGQLAETGASGLVKLEEIVGNGFVAIDSAEIGSNGAFRLTGQVAEEGFYRLNMPGTDGVVLVLDNKNLSVKPGAEPDMYEVEGSDANAYFRQIEEIRDELQSKVSTLENEYAMAVNANDEAKQAALKAQYERLAAESRAKARNLIKEAGTSVVSLYAVNLLNIEQDFAFMDSLATRFEKERGDSKYAKEYITAINNYKKGQQEMQSQGIGVGAMAPDFKLATPDGKTLSLSSLRGKYVLIDFWASWCGPCRQENPNVVKMYNRFKDRNFEILGVSLDQDKGKWEKAIEKDGLTWLHVSDLKGWQSAAAELYNVTGIPATYLIDKEGKVIAKNLRGKKLEDKIAEVISAGS
jgi:peroxiredoxin